MGRWLIGVVLLALWASPARACPERDGAAVASREQARPTTPTAPNEREARDERAVSEADARCEGAGCEGRRRAGAVDADLGAVHEPSPSDFGPGFLLMVMAPAIAILMIPIGLALWLMWFLRRRRGSLEPATREPISLLVVEQLARAMQRRGGVLAVLGVTGVPVLVGMQMAELGWAPTPTVIVSTIVACVGLRGFFVARGMLRMIESADQPTAELIGAAVILHRREEEMHVEISLGALDRARRYAVPRSIAKRA